MEKFHFKKIPEAGVGFRHSHFPEFEGGLIPQVDFFEAISENFLSTRGRPFNLLCKMREDFPFALHGVSLSIAGNEYPQQKYLNSLKELIEIIQPFVVSDHLCWTGGSAHNLHNLLPIPFNEESLSLVCERVDKVQSFLNRKIILENVSAYFTLSNSTMDEATFMNEICKKTGSGILLDINNIFVNSFNQGYEAYNYLDKINLENVDQIHLAGHSDHGDYLFDTHSTFVCQKVWDLYRYVIKKKPEIPTLVEWDEDIPQFSTLEGEALKVKKIKEEI